MRINVVASAHLAHRKGNMERPLNENRLLRASLGILVAAALGGARTERVWAETFAKFDVSGARISVPISQGEPFEPAPVPSSGGMASRLLAGIKTDLGRNGAGVESVSEVRG
jgi:hypothetical protein